MKNIHILPTDKPSRIHVDLRSTFLTPNYQIGKEINSVVDSINIYITSDEEIKEGDWCFYVNSIYKVLRINSNNRPIIKMSDGTFEISYYRKIILTTDQDLIKDGVQAIDDEFLEWFIKNQSCDSVEVEEKEVFVGFIDANRKKPIYDDEYKIIIPKEEAKEEIPQIGTKEFNDLASAYFGGKPKQETLEEAINNQINNIDINSSNLENIAKYNRISGTLLSELKKSMANIAKWKQERMYSEEDMQSLIKIRNYFGENDNTSFEHFAYSFLDGVIKQFKNK